MGSKIIPISPSRVVITQEELITLQIMRLKAKRVVADYRALRDAIRRALEDGAEVEPGAHTVCLHRRLVLD
jgi:hypothetical protein